MSNFLTFSAALIFAACAAAATKPFTYDTQTGNAPALNKLCRDFYIYVDMAPSPKSPTAYYQANPVRNNDFYYMDSSSSPRQTVSSSGAAKPTYIDSDTRWDILWWTDFEIKAVDRHGNTLYFCSTICLGSQYVVNGHSNIIDKAPKIFYLSDADSAGGGRCFGAKTAFTDFGSSIGATVGSSHKVSGVWLYPSLDSQTVINAPVYTGLNAYTQTRSVKFGDYIREIFTDPENTIIVWRQTVSCGEQLSGGRKRWIVVQPTFYGDFKVKTD